MIIIHYKLYCYFLVVLSYTPKKEYLYLSVMSFSYADAMKNNKRAAEQEAAPNTAGGNNCA
jgi:hypothetical protein